MLTAANSVQLKIIEDDVVISTSSCDGVSLILIDYIYLYRMSYSHMFVKVDVTPDMTCREGGVTESAQWNQWTKLRSQMTNN